MGENAKNRDDLSATDVAPDAAPARVDEPIAIIGMSCLFPKAQSTQEYWANIKNGVDGITEIPESHWSPEDYYHEDPKHPDRTYCRRGGFLSPVDFDPTEFGISPSAIKGTDTAQLLSLLVAQGALTDAGYGPDGDYKHSKTSVILGVTGTLELSISLGGRLGHPIWRKAMRDAGLPDDVTENIVRNIGDAYVAWQEDSFPGLLGNVVAGRVANRLNLHGTNCVVDAACASSISAAHLAALELASGRAELAVTGGVDAFNDIFMYMCFSKTPALSPTGDSKPFDASADGTIIGEGIGMIVMKRLADAERDGDRIYAVLKGIGTASDGRGKAIYAPDASGQARALRDAYATAGVSPTTVELVEGHGTGTKVGDAIEVEALASVFNEARDSNAEAGEARSGEAKAGPWCALGSVKSQIGHTKAAAGVAGMIKAILALRHKVLPPTIKVERPNPAIDSENGPLYLNTRKRPWMARPGHPRRAGVSAFGFGGSNFHAVLEEYGSEKTEVDWDGRVEIVALSAPSEDELRAKLRELASIENWHDFKIASARSRRDFTSSDAFRLVQVFEKDKTDTSTLLRGLLNTMDRMAGRKSWSTPGGAYFGCERKIGKIGFLFPGQGSQYVGMCLDLACVFPKMQETLGHADLGYSDVTDIARQLSDFIFPLPVFNDELEKLTELALRATQRAQPAIGAVSVGTLCILAMFGIAPQAAAGHSFGELVALFAAHRIDITALHDLALQRGELMAEAGGADGGSMLAVQAEFGEIETILAEHDLGVVIANHNAPRQVVLSGETAEIERASGVLREKGIVQTLLPVSAAFHSPLVADARGAWREVLGKAEFTPAAFDVYANTTGGVYPEDADEARDLLAGQIARPVQFVKMIETMYDDGVRTFIEVGPGGRLTSLAKSILGDKEDVQVIAVDASSGQGNGIADLARVIASVAAAGHEVDLMPWEDGEAMLEREARRRVPRMTVSICGANARPEPRNGNSPPPHTPSPAIARSIMSSPSQRESTAPKTPNIETAPHEIPVPPPEHPPEAGAAFSEGADPRGSVRSPLPAGNPQSGSFPSHVASQVSHPSLSHVTSSMPVNPTVADALRATQESLNALQQLQDQTAQLHHKFLQGQERAHETFEQLALAQQNLYARSLGLGEVAAPVRAMTSRPAPAMPAVPAVPAGLQPAPPPAAHAMPITPAAPSAPIPLAAQPQPSAAAPVVAAPAAAIDTKLIASTLLEVVAEKTGYPAEMLNLEMDMESDLGIDSIKRVEILSAMQEAMPEVNAPEPGQLAELRTLAQVIDFLGKGSGDAISGNDEPVRAGSVSVTPDSAMPDSTGADSAGVSTHALLSQRLLEIVSEKTGYPPEMLSLEMDMESDLGIDSIKRVEILSALSEEFPEAAAVEPEDLAKFRTLGQIIEYTGANMPGSRAAAQAPVIDEARTALSNGSGDTSSEQTRNGAAPSSNGQNANGSGLSAAVHAASGTNGSATNGNNGDSAYPAPATLTRSIVQAVELGEAGPAGHGDRIVPARGSLFILAGSEQDPLGAALADELAERGCQVRRISIDNPGNASEALSDLDGLCGLVILASPKDGGEAGAEAEAYGNTAWLKHAFGLARLAASPLQAASGSSPAVFATVARLDGAFGFREWRSEFEPAAGALAGLAKTADQEWDGVQCKAIDLAADWSDHAAAGRALAEEILTAGPVEVGLWAGGRRGLTLTEVPVKRPEEGDEAFTLLQPGDVVVVSGGARGVTAEAAVALAEAFGPTLVLLGRTALADEEPEWLRDLTEDSQIKKAILDESNGAIGNPSDLEREFRRRMAAREIRTTLGRIEQAGGRAVYRSVDVRDADAVGKALAEARENLGPIRGVIHGAGVLADKSIEDKTREQFDAVFDTKVEGLNALLGATREDDLKCLVLFSSVSARFGRRGQADYAMANELLNKAAHREAGLRPSCRVVAINWGPWAGGMVTPGLRRVFESEGVGLISLEAGARCLVDELGFLSDGAVEVVITSGEYGEAVEPEIEAPKLFAAFERNLEIEHYPILRSHVLGGRAVVPVALMLEWFGHAALHENPGFVFHGLNALRIFQGIRIKPGSSYRIAVASERVRAQGAMGKVRVEIRGGKDSETLHASADVLLATRLGAPPDPQPMPEGLAEFTRPIEELYGTALFHGADLRGLRRIESIGDSGIVAKFECAPSPDVWMSAPLRRAWLADPMAVDCALQLGLVWCAEVCGSPSLPVAIGEYRQYSSVYPEAGVRAVARARRSGERVALLDFDLLDAEGRLVATLRSCEFVMDDALAESFRRNSLAEPAVS